MWIKNWDLVRNGLSINEFYYILKLNIALMAAMRVYTFQLQLHFNSHYEKTQQWNAITIWND
jgi:hypothetical protein